MSTVVGIQGDGWSVLGADSQVSENNRVYYTPKGTGKIFVRNPVIVATVGDYRQTNVLNYNMKYPMPPGNEVGAVGIDAFVSRKLIPALRDCYTENGIFQTDKESGTDFLISVRGFIYAISSDFSWSRDVDGLYALGTGGDYALGSIATAEKPKTIAEAVKVVKKALTVACRYDTESGGAVVTHSHGKGFILSNA